MKFEILKKCPFCGEIKNIRILKRNHYEESISKRGYAIITIECLKCHVSMNDRSCKTYDEAWIALADRWNNRGWDEP